MVTKAQLLRVERDREIVAKAKAGTFYADIAAEYRLTFQRVFQICKQAGLELPRKQNRWTRWNRPPVAPDAPKPPATRDAVTKLCTRCGLDQGLSEFSRSSREADGLQDWCKPCNRESSAEYRAANAQKERERHALYHAANKEFVSNKTKRWRKENPEKVRTTARRFYARNRDKELSRHAAYAAANKERLSIYRSQLRIRNIDQRRAYEREYIRNNRAKVNAKTVRRKTRLMQALVAWADHEKIADFYAEAQRLTAETGIEHHVDHIVPLQSKVVCGLHCEANLQVLTGSENSRKHNKFIQ